MRTYIYIDGFNFYYGAVKNTPYKWLDFKLLFSKLLSPQNKIESIKYFTAMVTGKIDPRAPIRQKTYIRALKKSIPELEVHYGKFNSHPVWSPLVHPVDKKIFGKIIKFARVIKTEEKGSDVNLAVQLLHDAWHNRFDCAVVVSNDSDLAESLKLVKVEHKKVVGLINPHDQHPSKELLQHSTFTKQIRKGLLNASQLPDPIPGTTIRKPSNW